MNDSRPFCKDHKCIKCIKWTDELLRYELEEANEVCHGNWMEIQHQREYIVQLQELLTRHGIAVPPEY